MPLMNVVFGRLVGSFSEFSANITGMHVSSIVCSC